ncbi:tetratricopeptide repeat protein [Microcoleus sp. LEGE 07076]|uniref:tetratricopeptide repeat protein n=1 Tax=Microcoleus sp. LEGE 07076 TaxID=915322 RepID=UPI0018821C0E|nr:tetratricopeptide repeat protein [Microcoleus sp. LEGE 07076]MBE9187211.1 tetratricopeptide repeat protein [Microcoleus sp. LEGE 07076]
MITGDLIKQANQFKRQGKLDEALVLYHKIIKLNPNFPMAYYGIGEILESQGNLDESIEKYYQAINLNPSSSLFCLKLGYLFLKKGESDKAFEYFNKSKKNQPNLYLYKSYLGSGDFFIRQGNFKQALINYNKALTLNSQNAYVYLSRAFLYIKIGNLNNAKYDMNEALKLYPNDQHINLYSDFIKLIEKIVQKLNISLSSLQCDTLEQILDIIHANWNVVSQAEDLNFPKNPQFYHCMSELNFPGVDYLDILKHLHLWLKPNSYTEIGIQYGTSLKLASSSTFSIGIDPTPVLNDYIPEHIKIFALPSDDFFEKYNLLSELNNLPLDLAFIDGLHLFEQALKDFINLEKHSHRKTVICFHDSLPIDCITSQRKRVTKFWSGDIWKIVPILKQYRPDLEVFTVATKPTGLTIVTNLNPTSEILSQNYEEIVNQYMDISWISNKTLRYAMLSVVNNSLINITNKIEIAWNKGLE